MMTEAITEELEPLVVEDQGDAVELTNGSNRNHDVDDTEYWKN